MLKSVNTILIIVLIGLTLSGLSIPLIRKITFAANRSRTQDNLKALGLAMQSYHDKFKQLPPAFDRAHAAREDDIGTINKPVSVHVHLLPYLDQQAVFSSFLGNGHGNADAVVPVFISAMDGTVTDPSGVQTFAANLRVFSSKGGRTAAFHDMATLAAIEPGNRTLESIAHGGSNTIAFASKLARCGDGGSRYADAPTSPFAAFFGQNAAQKPVHYSDPASPYQWAPRGDECLCKPLMAQTFAPYPILAAWCDGSVRMVPGEVHPQQWNMYLHASAD